jgi:hypothetical protein
MPADGLLAVEGRQSERPRLGRLISAVLIIDCLPCLYKLFAGIEIAFERHNHAETFGYFAGFFLMAGIAALGLIGNILMCLRQGAGFFLAIPSILLAIVNLVFVIFFTLRGLRSPGNSIGSIIFLLFLSALWSGWLTVYMAAVWIAAKKLGWLRRNAHAEDRAA